MSIEYTYEITSVNEQARCMEIVYNAAGYPTMHIGARLPYEGETLEAIIRMYAPVRYWEESTKTVVVPEVGVSGSLAPLPTPAPAPVAAIPPADVINVAITDL
jgi:hypothetical protein